MGSGHFLVRGDKTSCGGSIISGCENHSFHGKSTARNGDQYICGVDKKIYHIAGGIPNYLIHGVSAAGTAHSRGTCACRCYFIPSIYNATYWYETKAETIKVSSTRSPVHVVPQPDKQAQNIAPPPPAPKPEPVKVPRQPVDAGFCVLPYGATPKIYAPWFFVNPPEGTRELYLKLNPEREKKPGSILIVVDPEKQDEQQIETLEKARDKIDAALDPLTLEEARLLHENRAAVDIFSSQIYSDALSTSGDMLGYISESGKNYYEEINSLLKEIHTLYQNTYNNNNGIISGAEFFGQRKRLFDNLNVVLNRFSKSQLTLKEYENIKKALGLSTSSIMHRWNQTGVGDIEGYANYIEKSANLIKIMKTTGYVGIGLDFASYSTNVYEACSKGREDECKKAAIMEYSKFGGKQAITFGAGSVAGLASRSACMWILGLATPEVGGLGSALCLATGVGFSIGASKAVEEKAEKTGEESGNIIYDYVFK